MENVSVLYTGQVQRQAGEIEQWFGEFKTVNIQFSLALKNQPHYIIINLLKVSVEAKPRESSRETQ